jgi:hypothetical protein
MARMMSKWMEEEKATFPNYTRARAINVEDGNFASPFLGPATSIG